MNFALNNFKTILYYFFKTIGFKNIIFDFSELNLILKRNKEFQVYFMFYLKLIG